MAHPHTSSVIGDLLVRFTMAGFCIYVLTGLLRDLPRSPLLLASRISIIGFFLISLILFVVRRRAIAKAPGLYARLVAFAGAFIMVVPLISPPLQHKGLLLAGTLVTFAGDTLSLMALYSLGRSFSIMAEARQLKTNGAYRFCRHPLYFSEGVAVVGVVIQRLSLATMMIFVLYLILQYGRIREEEKVLRSSFPDYENYKASTPMVIPRFASYRS